MSKITKEERTMVGLGVKMRLKNTKASNLLIVKVNKKEMMLKVGLLGHVMMMLKS